LYSVLVTVFIVMSLMVLFKDSHFLITFVCWQLCSRFYVRISFKKYSARNGHWACKIWNIIGTFWTQFRAKSSAFLLVC